MRSSAQLLRDLIALPSVNPAFLPADHPNAGEHRVADHLASVAALGGLDVEFQDVFSNRRNLFARLCPSGKVTRRILLAPHMDTVGLVSDAQLNPVEKSGRLYGRGACDTKGSVAAMLTALLQVAESGRRPAATEIVFIGLIDEENNQSGSRAVAKSGLQADLAIVGEPTRLQVVTAHKGDLWLSVETRGKAAHGARPELGKNAVHEMARIVDVLETIYRRQLKKRTHPLLGHATINVGSIRGGTQPNIVPDRCEIAIDRRTLPGETEAGIRREILTLLKKHGLSAKIGNNKGADCLALETDPGLPLVQQFLKVARQNKPVGVHYFCDAAVLSAGGIPSIVFGPGDIAQAHTADEWISLTSLERGTNLLTRFLRSLD
ncbi:MAG: M20/M25/M40 family metallo-hydrolase [Opitutaceae bacterium]|nr:M20/M25/M40 family metallo-hydrolase [Verrucomicrobiales bacterium]